MTESERKMDQAVTAIKNNEGKYLMFALANQEYGISILKIKEARFLIGEYRKFKPSEMV